MISLKVLIVPTLIKIWQNMSKVQNCTNYWQQQNRKLAGCNTK